MPITRAYAQAAEPGNFFVAGKNKIINGDFGINQRSFTSTTTSGSYGFDRWLYGASGGTVTYSAQTFTPGAAPVAGYEAANFARVLTSGQSAAGNYAALIQNIENVRTLANQTVTVSFWAKAASGTPKVFVELAQQFGSGGTPSSDVLVPAGSVTLSTSWARYSVTVAMPSISGKTIGTNANSSYIILNLWVSAGTTFDSRTSSLGIQNNTFDFWGVQVEAGAVATPFTTATGTLAGELAACQRYYQQLLTGTKSLGIGNYYGNNNGLLVQIYLPVEMRTTPTLSATSGTNYYAIYVTAGDTFDSLTLQADTSTRIVLLYNNSQVSGTAGYAGEVYGNSASASVGVSAEL